MNVDPIKFVFVSVSFFVVADFFEVNSYSVALRVTGIINMWRKTALEYIPRSRAHNKTVQKNAFISIEWNKRIICKESKQSKKKRFYYCSKTSFKIMQVSGTFIFTSVFVFFFKHMRAVIQVRCECAVQCFAKWWLNDRCCNISAIII